ncbi:ABC transporter permease subunit [Paenibacillus naphthalenovorans]|uniref:ABC transporter permease subunit n=1 Tax=Paenibacillus naphthalenovorans TaxID=162209 RepID=UPI0010B40FDA|nr:ABC transporter permease subunit [Paenibacillus naphthalenovorans]GCL72844.1 hypothetical protein PN4B1_27710 [Paenibacillus naphthalenovorans]
MDNSVISLLFTSLPLLFNGVIQTLWIAVYSLCISTVCGIVFGIFRMSSIRGIQMRTYVEIFRAVPVLVFMFFFFFGLPILWGIEVPGMLAAVLLHKLYDEYLKKEFGPEINPDDIVVEGGKL